MPKGVYRRVCARTSGSHAAPDFGLGHFGDPKPERHVFKNIHVGEQGIFLKDGIDLPFMGRDIINPHTVNEDVSGRGRHETA
jgi:hypothetical protein